MSGGGFKERDADVPRPPAPVLARMFEDIQLPAAQPMLEPAHGLGPPDPMALLDWMDDGPAKTPSNLLGFGTNQAGSAPIQLNPNAPPKQLPRGGPGPQLPPDDLARVGDTMEAQRLLTSKDLKSGDHANQALQILNDVPEEQRGKAIDGLNDQAFDNLLERVPHGDREKFEKLVEASQKPKRKLKLWAEFHKSRARNDLDRLKGDVGKEDGELQHDIDNLTREPGDPEKDAEFGGPLEAFERTDKQERNLVRHERRTSAVAQTHREVDEATQPLIAKAEKAEKALKEGREMVGVTLEDVDALRERKELEYRIERDNNLNLTAEGTRGEKNPEPVHWDTSELELVQKTLARLPEDHVRDPKVFQSLNRKKTENLGDGLGGLHHGETIDIFDWGASKAPGFRHGGDRREMVSDQFRRENGDNINTLEFVLTHEIGHDVATRDKKAFNKFKKAAGWQEMDEAALRKDNIDDKKLATLEGARPDPNSAQLNIGGDTKSYQPIKGKDTFWGVDQAAIPAAPGPDPKTGKTPADKWSYARVSPDEHFAELYAKAVHVPKQLHDDLVVKPAAAVEKANDEVRAQKRALAQLEGAPNASAEQIDEARLELGRLEGVAAANTRAEKQHGEMFSVMRNDVFHTNDATNAASARLQAKGVNSTAIDAFKQRAAAASTPEQVEVLERELHP